MMSAVVVGAGRVGCGFAAQLLAASGYRVSVIGRGDPIRRLRRHRGFTVHVAGATETAPQWVPLAGAWDQRDAEATARTISGADLVCTAVGPGALGEITAVIAEGLVRAPDPLDVIGFENVEDAGQVLREGVRRHIGAAADRHGYSGAVVDRVVAQRIIPADVDEPMGVIGESGDEFVVDAHALHGGFAPVTGMRAVTDFRAYYRRKLFRYSAGHATAAYLGQLKGYRYLHAAIRDPEIRSRVLTAMGEGRAGLERRYGPEVAGSPAEIRRIVRRFGNAALGDTVARVGRDVGRKVGHGERLVGPARLALEAGVTPAGLVRAIAAALHSQARVHSPSEARARVSVLTGLDPTHLLTGLIARDWVALSRGGHGLMLSLHDQTWAWARDVTKDSAPAVEAKEVETV